ncbi:MAG: dTMP kinase [Rhodoferax sp.]|nr:dTMP kinase [Rhodoferax sp.]
MNGPLNVKGLFISFEGIDGAGKSTHIAPLAQCLRALGRSVVLTREPGGTPIAEQLRQLVLNEAMDAMTEALLVFAARRNHLQQVIAPALVRGEVVLCDRFSDATFAYQGAGRGFDWDILLTLERWVQTMEPNERLRERLLAPDLTLWFDLPAEIAAQRLTGARLPDKFESQPAAFFEHVAAGYARRMQADPQRFVRINANQSADCVWHDVGVALRARGVLP